MKRVLALDFDGVLCDTLDECLITSINAYRKLSGNPARVSSLLEVKPDWVKWFRKNRPFVKPAGEYWIMAYWLHEEGGRLSGAEFEKLKCKHAATIEKFRPVFFEVRAELRNKDEQSWIALHKPFSQAMEGLAGLSEQFDIYFVSNKDRDSIGVLCRHLGLEIPDSRILTGEKGKTKPEMIGEIVYERGMKAQDILFVDDQLDHLFDVAETGAKCFWASWGYERDPKREHSFTRLKALREVISYTKS
ncbi:HAD family hydrolase [bacterium]|nr:MAG: HAD family hydrolase [bacterium]